MGKKFKAQSQSSSHEKDSMEFNITVTFIPNLVRFRNLLPGTYLKKIKMYFFFNIEKIAFEEKRRNFKFHFYKMGESESGSGLGDKIPDPDPDPQ
jgi:hypothetical protein